MADQQIMDQQPEEDMEDKLDNDLYYAEEAVRNYYDKQDKKEDDLNTKEVLRHHYERQTKKGDREVASVHEFLELAKAKRRKRVKIDAWDKYVWIRELTLGEQMEIEEKCAFIRGEVEKGSHVMFEMMKKSLQNSNGDPLIAQDAEYEDIKSHSIGFLQVGNEVVKFNSATQETQENLKKN